MKKFLLSLSIAALAVSAQAYWLPTPKVTSKVTENGKTTITWDYDENIEPCTYFQIVVYKLHKADADGKYVLSSSDFNYIESKGTINKHEERSALWDFLPDNPGWWVRYPLYMNHAMGVDAFQYFSGSSHDDIFGGAYMISPDYDLSKLEDRSITVKAELAGEATSVSGGFCIWAWNTNWVDPTNIDYKPVVTLDHHFDLSNAKFNEFEKKCTFPKAEDYSDPDTKDEINGICPDRTRVMFYGSGYSAYWINSFEVSVNMKKGETVDYGASILRTTDSKERTFTIDRTGDTDTDCVYAFEIRPVFEEYDDYRKLTTVRAVNYGYKYPKYLIDADLDGIGETTVDSADVDIRVKNGKILVYGAEGMTTDVYNIAGARVYSGTSASEINLPKGIYIVKVGTKSAKVIL